MTTHPLREEQPPPPLPLVDGGFQTVLADPPWRFTNRTGKVAPEHRRLDRYSTMSLDAICDLPVSEVAAKNAHLYLWVPNALLPEGLRVMEAWGFRYVSNVVWAKRRKDGGPDGRGVGFYFRNTTELLLFGVRGSMRTLPPARSQVNIIETRKREHSRKPDEQYDFIERCSPGPYLEMFARHPQENWIVWGDESATTPRGKVHKGYTGGEIEVPKVSLHSRLSPDQAATEGRADAVRAFTETYEPQMRAAMAEAWLRGVAYGDPCHRRGSPDDARSDCPYLYDEAAASVDLDTAETGAYTARTHREDRDHDQ